MNIKGSEIEVFDGMTVEFGESCYYTERRLEKRKKCRYTRKDGESIFGGCAIVLKNVFIFDIPAKCVLEYNKGNLGALTYKVRLAAESISNVVDAEGLASAICDKFIKIYGPFVKNGAGSFTGGDDKISIDIYAKDSDVPTVIVRISPREN